jgi:hypothetical protein
MRAEMVAGRRRLVPELLRRNAPFRRFWAAESISLVGDQISFIALPLVAVLTLGAGPAQMGYLTAANLVPNLPSRRLFDRARLVCAVRTNPGAASERSPTPRVSRGAGRHTDLFPLRPCIGAKGGGASIEFSGVFPTEAFPKPFTHSSPFGLAELVHPLR